MNSQNTVNSTVKVIHSRPTLRPHGLYSAWNSPGQNTGVGSLLQGIFPNPGIKPRSPALQADSLPAEPPGKPIWSSTNALLFLSR